MDREGSKELGGHYTGWKNERWCLFLVALSVRRQEASWWKVEHLMHQRHSVPCWSKEADMQVWMAVESPLQTESTLAKCVGAGGAIFNPQSRGDGWISPSEIILQQRCNCSRSASLASLNSVSLWPCQKISGAPLVTSFSCILLKGTTCTQEPPPCPSEVVSSRVTIWHFWASDGTGTDCSHLPPVQLSFATVCVCLWCQVLLGESHSDPVCFATDIAVLVNLCWGTACSCVRRNCCHCTQCIQFYLISAAGWLKPLRSSLLKHLESLFSFLMLVRPEEMVIFAEVICPLWTLFEWTDELHSLHSATSAQCHQRDKFCPQMSEWARNSELCTCVWWPYVSHLLSIEFRSLNLQAQCWESVLQYLRLLFNFNLSRSFASWFSYN